MACSFNDINGNIYYYVDDKAYVSKDAYDKILCKLKQAKNQIAKLEDELSVKENLLKIKNGLCGETDISELLPIEVAEKLINAETERNFGEEDKVKCSAFSVSDLRQIAEHLMVYCDYNS